MAGIVGGATFGYGMALAGNCGFGALARFGGGDLRSLVVVVVMAIFSYITLNGPLANLRALAFPQMPATGTQDYANLIWSQLGLPPLLFATLVAAAFLIRGLSYPPLRASHRRLTWAVAAGLSVSFALWGNTTLHTISFGEVPVEGHTFTALLGRTLLWLMTSSSGGLSFSVGSVAGVLAGAFVGSTIKGLFRRDACEDPRELGRQVSGAALMGIGGVVAMGCSVGQGLTGFATLAYSAPITLAAIYFGASWGLRRLIQGYQPD